MKSKKIIGLILIAATSLPFYSNAYDSNEEEPQTVPGKVIRGTTDTAGNVVEGAGRAAGNILEGTGNVIGGLFGGNKKNREVKKKK